MAKPRTPKKSNGEIPVPPVETASATPATAVTASTESKPEPRKAVRKPTLVKSEPRMNLVPINVEDEIRQLAYLMSERRGFEPGHETEDWLAAEREVRQRYHQYSA
jgi:hypothetical protein